MGTRLYVGNLPYSATEDELRRLFEQSGSVDSVYLPTDRQTGQPRGFGFVEMTNGTDAENAVRMYDGYTMGGRQIRVNTAREREERGGGGGGGGGYGGGGGGGGRRY
ncbi:MAG: RNA recognition motif domain-containing protein [Chloroflexota bacterium]